MKSKIKNLVKVITVFSVIFLIASCNKKDKRPKDADGYVYDTIQIGDQVWMKENLRTSKYNDGDSIPSDKSVDWEYGTVGAYTIYKDPQYPDKVKNEAKYGKLYNWHAVNSGKLAPKGWHVATRSDWDILDKFLGHLTACKKLKTTHSWDYFKDATGTDESGFSALPGGERSWGGDTFYDLGKGAYFWTSSMEALHKPTCVLYPTCVIISYANPDNININVDYYKPNFGMSVRCVKD